MAEPTREQIAARLRGDIFDAVPDDNDMQHVLTLAAALLSQPTPVAECSRCGHRLDVHAEHGGRGEGCELCMCPAFQRAAEPPRIEDMAPGTTFRAQATYDGELLLMLWTGTRLVDAIHLAAYVAQDRYGTPGIDPSTIRDVTPPTTEE